MDFQELIFIPIQYFATYNPVFSFGSIPLFGLFSWFCWAIAIAIQPSSPSSPSSILSSLPLHQPPLLATSLSFSLSSIIFLLIFCNGSLCCRWLLVISLADFWSLRPALTSEAL